MISPQMYLPDVPDTVGPHHAHHARHACHYQSYQSCPNPSHVTLGSRFLKTRNNAGKHKCHKVLKILKKYWKYLYKVYFILKVNANILIT